MLAFVVVRNAIKRLPPLKQYTLSWYLSLARTVTPVCSLLPEYESSRPSVWWSALLLATLSVTTLVPTVGTALVEEGPDAKDEGATTIVNWLGTHMVELVPGTYHAPKTLADLVALVERAYRAGWHICPVGSALLPNSIAFDRR